MTIAVSSHSIKAINKMKLTQQIWSAMRLSELHDLKKLITNNGGISQWYWHKNVYLFACKTTSRVQGYVITPASNQKSCSRNHVSYSLSFSICFSSSCHRACSSVNPPSATQKWWRRASGLENWSVCKRPSKTSLSSSTSKGIVQVVAVGFLPVSDRHLV